MRYSAYGVPRAANIDGTRDGEFFVVKSGHRQRLTYQLFLLTVKAQNEGKPFVLVVAQDCELSPDLQWFLDHNDHITLRRIARPR